MEFAAGIGVIWGGIPFEATTDNLKRLNCLFKGAILNLLTFKRTVFRIET
jgi:hypothetical protein